MNSGPIHRQTMELPPKTGRLRREIGRDDCLFAMALLQSLATDDRAFADPAADMRPERPATGNAAAAARPGSAPDRNAGSGAAAFAMDGMNDSETTAAAYAQAIDAADSFSYADAADIAATTMAESDSGASQIAGSAVGTAAGSAPSATFDSATADTQSRADVCIADGQPVPSELGNASVATALTSLASGGAAVYAAASATGTSAAGTAGAGAADGTAAPGTADAANLVATAPSPAPAANPASSEITIIPDIDAVNTAAAAGSTGAGVADSVRTEVGESWSGAGSGDTATGGRKPTTGSDSGVRKAGGSGAWFATGAAADMQQASALPTAAAAVAVADEAAVAAANSTADPAAELDVTRLVSAWHLQSDSVGQTLTVRLTPDVFGAMSIRLERTADGFAATIRTDNQAACSLLAAQRDQLEMLLQAKGFNCRGIDIAWHGHARSAAFGSPVTDLDPAGSAHAAPHGQADGQAFAAGQGAAFGQGQGQAQGDRQPDSQANQVRLPLASLARARPDGPPQHSDAGAVRRNAYGRLDWWA